MIEKHICCADLVGKTIDIHSHAGIQIREAAQISFPYCASVEDLAYRQRANGVDASVVFPTGPDLFFDLQLLIETGRKEPAASPISRAPYERENRLLLTDVFNFCPEHSGRFLPFISVDPGRLVDEQIAILRELEAEFPIYGVKIAPVSTQTRVTALLGEGSVLRVLRRAGTGPSCSTWPSPRARNTPRPPTRWRSSNATPSCATVLAHGIGFHRELLERADSLPNVWVDTFRLKIQVELAYHDSPLMALPPGALRVRLRGSSQGDAGAGRAFPRDDHLGHRFTLPQLHHAAAARGRGLREFRLKGTYEGRRWPRWDALTPDQRAQNNANAWRSLFGGNSSAVAEHPERSGGAVPAT